ncbi:MAG: heat-inducible transcriptional repressor HrcA [Candidatus Omnitrophota bacterium]
MFVTDLNKRRNKILQTIVELYTETAVPVSSQAIAQRLRSRVSTATVRNMMQDLDELGLIWQPHTSAGRIPTDLGYRYYIDSLLEQEQLTYQEKELIERQYPAQQEVFDELLKEMLRILSNFSGYTTMAFSSGLRRILFKRLELVSVESTKLLVMLVSPEGRVKTALIQLPYQLEQEELSKIARFLNDQFEALTLDEIKERLSLQVLSTHDAFFHILEHAHKILELAQMNFGKDMLYLEGTSHILEYPEFHSAQKLQAVFKAFEQQESLLAVFRNSLDYDGVQVRIGKENPYAEIQDCSLVISNFKAKNKNLGALGIIGPRRMAYARVIAAVNYMCCVLNERIARTGI